MNIVDLARWKTAKNVQFCQFCSKRQLPVHARIPGLRTRLGEWHKLYKLAHDLA